MPKPTAVNTTNADAGTDVPSTFRADVLDLINKFNGLLSQMTAFVWDLLASTDAAAARNALVVPSRTGGNASGDWDINISGTAASVSTSGALAALAGASVGAVGSQAMLRLNIAATALPGDTVAGASLLYSSAAGTTGASPSGIWRCLGYANGSAGGAAAVSMWLRIE